jgi:uncharacterized protein with NRDE domain
MCTVVCRVGAVNDAFPVQMLALRDELRSREFDLPGQWWPDAPGVVGGRDRQAGGTWCASNLGSGVTGVVLNRPERPVADPGAPSRGVLPLLAARCGSEWAEAIELTGMASFNLVLAGPGMLSWWSYDGERLDRTDLAGGTYMFTPRGIVTTPLDARFTAPGDGFSGDMSAAAESAWEKWLAVVRDSTPSDDPQSLLVRRPVGDDVFQTVFGQFIAARPGTLRLDYLLHPATREPWSTKVWHRG